MHWANSLLGGGVLGSIITGTLVYLQSLNKNKSDLNKSYPGAISTLNQQVTQLTKERAKYAGQSINLQRKVDGLQDTVHDQDKIIREQTQTINALRGQVGRQNQVIDKLNTQVGEMSKKLDRLGKLQKEEIKNERN
ncbi:hypothetical protein [Limosilactobacillus fermentum]|uniref:hypothetical protein n=1 Tax=Limosilactobacillus fermentum TaxID=1613 RepID=UPI0034633323